MASTQKVGKPCKGCGDKVATLGGLLETAESELATLRQAHADMTQRVEEYEKMLLLLSAEYDKLAGDGSSKPEVRVPPSVPQARSRGSTQASKLVAVFHRPVQPAKRSPV